MSKHRYLCIFSLALALPLCGLQDPGSQGGPILTYRFDIEDAIARGELPAKSDPETVMRECVKILQQRARVAGAKFQISHQNPREVVVQLPQVPDDTLQLMRRRIESNCVLEMRLVASEDYRADEVAFNLPDEKKRLEQWLDEGDNRAKLAKSPEHIDGFNNLPLGEGRLSAHIVWYPHQVFPMHRDPKRWGYAASRAPGSFTVPAFTPKQHAARAPKWKNGEERPFLVEFFPVNMHATHFTGADLEAGRVRAGVDPGVGNPCVYYELNAEKKSAYADWSEENIGEASAIIVNGTVWSAPVFQGRIYGAGRIVAQFTKQEAEDLARGLRARPFPVAPEFVSQR